MGALTSYVDLVCNAFSDIANSIRHKTNSDALIYIKDMPAKIDSIATAVYPNWWIYSNNAESTYALYKDNSTVNTVTVIQEPTTNVQSMFNNCARFDSTVAVVTEHVDDFSYMFYNCRNMNQLVRFPDAFAQKTNMKGLFQACVKYNCPVDIPKNVTHCGFMFSYCYNFNSPVTLPDTVTNCYAMFQNTAFRQNITIPNSAIYCQYMFDNCTGSGTLNIETGNVGVNQFFASFGPNPSNPSVYPKVQIFTDLDSINNIKNSNIMISSGSPTQITEWQQDTNGTREINGTVSSHNGFMNAVYNMYLYDINAYQVG